MSPQELLKATQDAAGHEKLSTWHKNLIVGGKDLAELVAVSSIMRLLTNVLNLIGSFAIEY